MWGSRTLIWKSSYCENYKLTKAVQEKRKREEKETSLNLTREKKDSETDPAGGIRVNLRIHERGGGSEKYPTSIRNGGN